MQIPQTEMPTVTTSIGGFFTVITNACMGVLGLIALMLVWVVINQPIPISFKSDLWKNCEDKHELRYKMHRDFLRRYQVVGMTKEKLIELLGKPDGISDKEISWDLGQYFGADDSAIDFELKDGKVVSYSVWGY